MHAMRAVLVLLAMNGLGAQVTALRFGTLVDGRGGVLRDAVVVVEKDRIVSVGVGAGSVPRGAAVVDLRRYTAIPGLIDVHTHLTYYRDAQPRPAPARRGPALPQVTVFLSQANARKTLETGVTTVRDLGAQNYSDVAMRDLIDRAAMVGPRMLVSGYGLQKPRQAAGAPPSAQPAQPSGRARDTTEIRQVIRAQVDAGADVIKMYGSSGSGRDTSGTQTFTLDEMRVAADAARALGKRIAIHSYGAAGGRDAVRAGAHSVEHATDLDDATLAEMATRGTFYVPTVDHNRYYAEYREFLNFTPADSVGLDVYRARNLETLRRAVRAGVKVAMGSDVVYTMFGQNTRELLWFVQAGMTPAQALATATTNAAELLGMSDRIGALVPGHFADIVAVDGNPLADINVVVHGVRWVMKAGTVLVDRR